MRKDLDETQRSLRLQQQDGTTFFIGELCMDRFLLRNSETSVLHRADLYRRVLICFLLVLLLAGTRRADAQFETASVLGYVRDSSGHSIAGSTVKLINTATAVTVVVTTDSQGQYQFTDVHVGQYKIDAGASGFNEAVTDLSP